MSGVREGLLVSREPASTREDAHRGETLRVSAVREGLQVPREPAGPREDAHRGETVRVSAVREGLQVSGQPASPREDAHWGESLNGRTVGKPSLVLKIVCIQSDTLAGSLMNVQTGGKPLGIVPRIVCT